MVHEIPTTPIGVCGRHHCFPVVTLVGANTAHVLNIMVQAGLKVIPNAIGSVRDIIKVVTSSPSRMQIFNSIVKSLGFRSKSGLVLDVPHCWNAT